MESEKSVTLREIEATVIFNSITTFAMKPQDEKIYGLIGFPLTHSFSKVFFNQKFQAEGITEINGKPLGQFIKVGKTI